MAETTSIWKIYIDGNERSNIKRMALHYMHSIHTPNGSRSAYM